MFSIFYHEVGHVVKIFIFKKFAFSVLNCCDYQQSLGKADIHTLISVLCIILYTPSYSYLNRTELNQVDVSSVVQSELARSSEAV